MIKSVSDWAEFLIKIRQYSPAGANLLNPPQPAGTIIQAEQEDHANNTLHEYLCCDLDIVNKKYHKQAD